MWDHVMVTHEQDTSENCVFLFGRFWAHMCAVVWTNNLYLRAATFGVADRAMAVQVLG